MTCEVALVVYLMRYNTLLTINDQQSPYKSGQTTMKIIILIVRIPS